MLTIVDNGGLRGTNTPMSGGGDLIVRGGAIVSSTYYLPSYRSLFVGSNSWCALGFLFGSSRSESWTVTSNATIEAGGGITVDGRGHGPGGGPGGGRYSNSSSGICGGGGGYGGWGGNGGLGGANSAGGIPYGSYYNPITGPLEMGSGGGNLSSATNESYGGGALRLNVGGLLKLDGTISANGLPGLTGGGGGGAGGSVWLTVGGLAGTGSISANGGAGDLPYGGGGGGGRIAITWTSNSFTGSISARGGNGFVAGGAGTIYTKRSLDQFGQLLVDNGGLRGTNTLVLPFSPTGDLFVQGGGIVVPSTSITFPNLTIFPNSTIMLTNQTLTVSGSATVHPGASIFADGTGSRPGVGIGSGNHSLTPKGGGSHGGLGGANPFAVASGTVTGPTSFGSGGANGSGSSGTAPFGGSGGGAVRMNVTGTLTVDGRISADGTGGGLNSGGGAGGSVWLTAGTLAGTGTISANGGAGHGTGGGGGGGRVALQFTTNLFAGSVTAFGGTGSVAGGAGTVYRQQTGKPPNSLTVDNGGVFGTNTPLFGLTSGLDLSVAGGAVAYPQVPFPLFNSVNLGEGGVITHLASQTKLELATIGDLNIKPGGEISVGGKGFSSNTGNGPGGWVGNQGGGGGHGGAGGAAANGAPGGAIYGSAAQPVDRGSGGGALLPGGSEGGGAIRLSVGGALRMDGLLSANGNAGWQDDSGGGAGGSIWVTANALTGGGTISASGGDGEWFNGGGGGGGRIALYSPVNTHTVLVSVVGGFGANPGQSGTVFTSTSLPGFAVVSHSPSGVVSNVVSTVVFTFSEVVNPSSVSEEDFVMLTPAGPQPNLTAVASGLFGVSVSFPAQNLPGEYQILAGPNIEDLYGQSLSQVHTGAFTVVLPTISGTVTDTNGQPVPDVILQPSGGWLPATTDGNGRYSLAVPPGWTGNVTPMLAGRGFVPGARAYTNLTDSLNDQNYLVVDSIAPQLACGGTGTNLWLRWNGIPDVTYQVWTSTNLTDWLPWGEPKPGTNGLMEAVLPVVPDELMRYFRLRAAN